MRSYTKIGQRCFCWLGKNDRHGNMESSELLLAVIHFWIIAAVSGGVVCLAPFVSGFMANSVGEISARWA